ncbi:MAG TPA: GNAT family N-acetyltransferase [Acidothermales bacterium]
MLRTVSLRLLDDRDRGAALALTDADPMANVFVGSRIRAAGLDPWRLGGEVWGVVDDGRLTSICYAGGNLVPVGAGPDALQHFAERGKRQGRRCSSINGPAQMVLPLWEQLEPGWGPARDVRPRQPLMMMRDLPHVTPDPAVRRVLPHEADILLPASIAMSTEEVGVSPTAVDGGALYRARVRELIATGRSYARIEDGRVIFKADVGSVTPHACQIQGVWVTPDRRGERLSIAGMAAVVRLALQQVAPVVTLYVNDYNAPALAAYRRVGFTQVGTFASILF